jgi:transcriptional regulator with XRE-family HTH domain
MEWNPLVRLGNAIRRLREKSGMTQTELAKLVFLSKSTISNIENGTTPVKEDMIVKLDGLLNAEGLLVDLWFLATTGNYSPEHVASQEVRAIRIQAWDNRVFPGLLQTANYARCVMHAARPFDSDEEIEHDVELRMDRQNIWERDNPPTGWFVFDESALFRPFGGKEVMVEQINRIISMASRPRIFVQVMRLSVTSHPGAEGPLRIVHYSDAHPSVYTEGWYAGRTTEVEEEVLASMTYFDLICGSAMSPEQSVEFIAKIKDMRYGE